MQLSFRAKLRLIIGTTALGFLLMLGGGALSSVQQNSQLANVEGRLVPKLELGPRLASSFEHLRQSLQDAVAAEDLVALDATRESKSELLRLLAGSEQVIPPADSVPLRHAINDYYSLAFDVSRRLIRHESGEAIVDAMSDMRARHIEATRLVDRAARLDREELNQAFLAVRDSNREMMRNIVGVGSGCLLLVLLLGWWVGRAALRTLGDLSSGFARLAREDFSQSIPVYSGDELGQAAQAANRMASALEKLAADRDHSSWIRAGISELSDELRGDPSPRVAAATSITALCRRLRAGVGLFYLSNPAGELRVVGHYGLGEAASAAEHATFRAGEGLVGQACLADELLVIDQPPLDYFRVRSGLGDMLPRSLVFVPLLWRSRVVGVLEIGLLEPCPDRCRELLSSVRELLAVRLDALYARELERDLLGQTREQAEQLTVQEEELRANNLELSVQQEELRETNELLEAQRRILTEQNSELEQMRLGLEDKAKELEKVSTYKSHFLANMSHELRTPLNSMLLLSHLLCENEGGNLTDKQVNYSRTIHCAGKDLLGLINQVLDLAKVESGRQDVHLEPVPLVEIRAHALRSFEAMARERGLAFRVNLAADLPPTIVTDRQRVERILINLLGNAIKFTSYGSVTLDIQRPAEGAPHGAGLERQHAVAFAVRDTGIGVAAADRDRVFAPFEQVESRADRRYGGTGLGLAIARESAHLLGGELTLESEFGRGSTFTLALPELPDGHIRPRSPAPTNEEDALRPAEIVDDRSAILLVEDDRVEGDSLMGVLGREGLTAQLVMSAEGALVELGKRRFGCMILDLGLPDMGGLGLLEALHSHSRLEMPPVVVHTARSLTREEMRRIETHAQAIVLKDGSSKDRLLDEVKLLMNRTSEASPATQHPVLLDGLVPDVSLGGKKILLAEDDMRTVYALSALLRAKGAEVLVAETGREALALLLQHGDVHGVLMDIMMPEMDGYEAIREVRAQACFRDLPVIALTARAMKGERERCLESGASDYLSKPVDPALLLTKLDTWLSPGRAQAHGPHAH